MGVYDRQRASALRQIKAKGKQILINRDAGVEVKDPITQAVTTSAAPQLFKPWALGLPASSAWKRRNETLVLTGMEELHVAPEGYYPTLADRVLWKGKPWAIHDWIDYDPNDEGSSIYIKLLIGR